MAADDDFDPQKRIAYLEGEVARLRAQIGEADEHGNVHAPWFNMNAFNKVLVRMGFLAQIPMIIFVPLVLIMIFRPPFATNIWIGPVPLFDLGGTSTGLYGLGLGIFAMGGFSVGVFAFGGGAVGVFAFGGGAVGLVAMGGGAVGFIAWGGGAVGYVAMGGGAFGTYVLAQKGYGKYVLARNRQDIEAAEFFKRYIPGLSKAIGRPMEVVPVAAGTS